jgi:hypothetical protein
MAESWHTNITSYAIDDPAAAATIYLLRAPTAAQGGGITILGAEAVQSGTASLSHGVGGTTFTLQLMKYTNAATPAVYGTISNAIGGTAVGWGAGRTNEFTITTSGTTNYLSPGEWLVADYVEVNAGNPNNLSLVVRWVYGKAPA